MLLYYITDRRQFPGSEADQRRQLLDKIAEAAAAGVDYVQLRERDLTSQRLESLARDVKEIIRAARGPTRLLVNSRLDVALACGADGLHLRADDIRASDVRAIVGVRPGFVVSVSCHAPEEVTLAKSQGADLMVFAPVFEKEGRPGQGLEALRRACAAASQCVLALGGVTPDNASLCLAAGAAGVAGIRLFQQSRLGPLAPALRSPGGRIPKRENNPR